MTHMHGTLKSRSIAGGIAVVVLLLSPDHAKTEVKSLFRSSHLSIFESGDPDDPDDDVRLLRTDDDPTATQVNLQGSLAGHSASQQMTIDVDSGVLHSFAGNGSTSLASGGGTGGAQTFSSVGFDVTNEPAFYYLDANLTRQDTLSRSSISLSSDLTGIPIARLNLNATSGTIMETGTIPVGERYQLDVSANGNGTFDYALLFGGVRWEEPVNGLFTDAQRWTAELVPQATGGVDSAVFDVNTNPYTVTFDQSITHRAALVRRGNVTFDLGSHTYALDELTVRNAPGQTASLTITGADDIVVSAAAGSTSDPVVPAQADPEPDSQLHIDDLNVRGGLNSGASAINVIAPTVVSSASIDGELNVRDKSFLTVKEELIVGENNVGSLTVSGGAFLKTNDDVIVAKGSGDFIAGFITIETASSWTATGPVIIGQGRLGRLGIDSGGRADLTGGLTIGAESGSMSIVSVRDPSAFGPAFPTLIVGPKMTVGDSGTGSLSVTNKATVEPPFPGHLEVDVGQGSLLNVADAQMFADVVNVGTGDGGEDQAVLFIADGARFFSGPLGLPSDDPGIVQVGVDGPGLASVGLNPLSSAFWGIKTELKVGSDGIVRLGPDARIVVGESWRDFPTAGIDGKLTVTNLGTVSGDGIIEADVDVAGGGLPFSGIPLPTVNPVGNSPGTLTIKGNYQQQGGLLQLDIAGPLGSDQHDVLHVTGDAMIDGVIMLKFMDEFAPSQDDTFDFLMVDNTFTEGSNMEVMIENLAPGFDFDVDFSAGSLTMTALNDGVFQLFGDCNADGTIDAADLACVVDLRQRDIVLTVLNTLPGDFDGNGDVSFADFLVLSTNFGQNLESYTDGNIDLKGAIDFADFLVLSANFGKTLDDVSAVPEPNGVAMILLGLIGAMASRRRVTR